MRYIITVFVLCFTLAKNGLNMLQYRKISIIIIFILLFNSCKTVQEKDKYYFKKEDWDDAPINEGDNKKETLITSLEKNIQWLTKKSNSSYFQLKDIKFSTESYLCSSKKLLESLKNNENILLSLKNNFDLYKVYSDDNQDILYTGYYIPVAEASEKHSKIYQTPVYKTPPDLVSVYLQDFNPIYKGKVLRGRVQKNQLIPYWTREEIVDKEVLSRKNLEIAWVKNKVDLFFIEIQGSGLLTFENGKKKYIHYSSQNGRDYSPIGALLFKEGHLEKSKITMQSIREWLEKNPNEKSRVLNYNKSFVFFSLENDGPYGNINVKLTEERSIAADQSIYPAGTLTLLDFKMPPSLKTETNLQDLQPEQFRQLAFVQDTGGAIKGAQRIDVFWGEGNHAGEIAGVTQQNGNIFILVPKNVCNP